MKKSLILLLCILVILLSLISLQNAKADEFYEGKPCVGVLPSSYTDSSSVKPPVISAGAAIVIDADSGRVLYEKDAYKKVAMASTTKIMTAIVAIENGNMEDSVTISKRAAGTPGSSINLREGEILTLKELMYGLMLNSGNDAAIAIAEHIGGTVEGFVSKMNEKALELGAKDTCFKSPHGLDMKDHYTTAYDLANITRYALSIPLFSKIVNTKSTAISGRSLYNTNELLDFYPGANGVKTGYTGQAGRCLVASATREDFQIISVVLNCGDRAIRAQNSMRILDYGFDNYKPYVLLKEDESIADIPLIKGIKSSVAIKPVEGIKIPLRADEKEMLEKEVTLPKNLQAPVKNGVEIGEVRYVLNGKVIAQSYLKVAADVNKKGVFDYLGEFFDSWVRAVKVLD